MSEPTQPPIEIVALVRDLLFTSKISTTARLLDLRDRLKIVRDPGQLADLAGRRLIVDLNAAGHLDAAVAWKARTGGTVVGFIAHVDADAIASARAMGIDRVLSNGGFSANLDAILKGDARS